MAHEHDLERDVWKTIDKIRFCFLASWDGTRQRLHPLTAMPDRDRGVIEFLASARSLAHWRVEAFPNVTLGFADPKGDDYVALFGHAAVSDSRTDIRRLWSPFAKAWWDSPDDPDIRVLRVRAEEAETWKGPNRLVAGALMLAAATLGTRPDMGEHGKTGL